MLGLVLQKRYGSNYEVMSGEVSCGTYQLTVFQYVCTEDERKRNKDVKVRRRGIASSRRVVFEKRLRIPISMV